jgi:hypothetical protein
MGLKRRHLIGVSPFRMRPHIHDSFPVPTPRLE